MQSVADLRHLLSRDNQSQKTVGFELDATINFRVNSELKAQFEDICKRNHSTISQELKKHMSKVLAANSLG
jgi:hypothetical protein